MNQEELTARILDTVNFVFAELMKDKLDGRKGLSYVDGTMMSAKIRQIFIMALKKVPVQIDAVCRCSEAVLAPSLTGKKKLTKSFVGIAGVVGGIGMIINGIAAALGWGESILGGVRRFFWGTELAGPIVLICAGVATAAIAGYFAFSGDYASMTERYMNCLKSEIEKAMPGVWAEHGEKLGQWCPK